MATNAGSSDSTNSTTGTEETSAAEGTEEQQSTEETSGQDADKGQQEDTDKGSKDDKDTAAAKRALLADLNKERKALKDTRSERDTLKTEVETLRPVKETLDAVQSKFDRLEAFLVAAGGTLGKALDSRSFTDALFGSDKDIADIVKDWNKLNPSATSTALGSAAAAPGKGKQDPNALLRAAAGH